MPVMKNITFLTGYYGSGKSEIAINLAIQKQLDILIDLDIINPYFRSRELENTLNSHGIATISSDLDYKTHIDLPFISKKVFLPFQNKELRAIYDLGGNDLGAKLLRQFEDYSNVDYDLFLVININRPETDSVDKILKLINAIEGTGGFKITGLINNSNFLRDTLIDDILTGEKLVKEVSSLSKLPIVYTAYMENIDVKGIEFSGEKLPIKLYLRKSWF